MHKCQEALNRVNKAITIALACQGIDLKEDNETVLALKTLQELVDKTTPLLDKEAPKSVILYTSEITNSEEAYSFYTCPECRHYVDGENYCPDCGQKLDWSDD